MDAYTESGRTRDETQTHLSAVLYLLPSKCELRLIHSDIERSTHWLDRGFSTKRSKNLLQTHREQPWKTEQVPAWRGTTPTSYDVYSNSQGKCGVGTEHGHVELPWNCITGVTWHTRQRRSNTRNTTSVQNYNDDTPRLLTSFSELLLNIPLPITNKLTLSIKIANDENTRSNAEIRCFQ